MQPTAQCQRSDVWLTDAHWLAGAGAGLLRCPGGTWTHDRCQGGESYQRRDPSDLGLDAAVAFVGSLLDQPAPEGRLELWQGELPETKPLNDQLPGVRQVYISRDLHPQWVPYEIGHEAAHVVLSPSGVFHWAHEMLAVLASVAWTEVQGGPGAGDQARARLRARAATADGGALLAADRYEATSAAYGWLYVLGADLLPRTSWMALRDLAVGNSGRPADRHAWSRAHCLEPTTPALMTFLAST